MKTFREKAAAAGRIYWPVPLLAALVLYLLREGLFPPFPGYVFSREAGDLSTLYFHWRHFGFSALRSGTVPLWNPYVFAGAPFAAYPEAALFYPLNLIFLLFPLPAALNLSFILHFGFLAVSAYFWYRFTGSGRLPSLAAGAALTFSGPVILRLTAGHLSNVCTLAWVPAVFILTESFFRTRKLNRAAGAGALVGLQLLAGHWQYAFYTALAAGAFLTGRFLLDRGPEKVKPFRLAAGAALAGLAALGLAAVQIFPALELAGESFRRDLDFQWAAAFSLPPANLATFILPGWLGDSLTSLYRGEYYFWEMCAYLGFIPLVLAGGAIVFRKDRFTLLLALLTVLAVLVALGPSTPLFRILYALLPGFRYFRGHAKILFFAVFFLSTLAARGADGLFGGVRLWGSPAFRRRLAGAGAALLLLAGAAALVFAARAGAEPPGWWRDRIERDLLTGRHYEIVPPGQPGWWERLIAETPPDLDYPGYIRRLVRETPVPAEGWMTLRRGARRLGVSAAGLGLILGAVLLRRRRRFLWAAAACLLAAGEAANWATPYVTGFDSRVCLWDETVSGFFRGQEEPFRYLPFDPADFNRGMTGGFESVLGYQADVPRRFLEYLNYSQGLPLREPELVPMVTDYSPLLDLLNVRFLLFPPGTAPDLPWLRPAVAGPGGELRENLNARPRVLVAGRGTRPVTPEAVLAGLARPGYRPETEVFLEGDPLPDHWEAAPGKAGDAEITARGLNWVRVEAVLERPGVLLLNESFAPGWKAYREGEEIPVFRANYLMRAVLLEPGAHAVEFRYRPLSFPAGAAVSLAALLALAVGIPLAAYRDPRRVSRSLPPSA